MNSELTPDDGHRLCPKHVEFRTLLTYLLTPWSRVLLEKLTGSAASQEIPRIFGTRRFITVLTSARHLSLVGLIINKFVTMHRHINVKNNTVLFKDFRS